MTLVAVIDMIYIYLMPVHPGGPGLSPTTTDCAASTFPKGLKPNKPKPTRLNGTKT